MLMPRLLPIVFMGLAVAAQSGEQVDPTLPTARSDETADPTSPVLLERIAFGSCNKQKLSGIQSKTWKNVQNFKPQLWLWTGDAVYASNHSVEALHDAYRIQGEQTEYHSLLHPPAPETPPMVDGTWDDHDLGINDGGAEVPVAHLRQEAFLDFLGTPKDSPRRRRKGLYR